MNNNSELSRDNHNDEIQSENDEEEKSGLIKRNLDGSFGATPLGAACSSSDQEDGPLQAAETGIGEKRSFFSNSAYDFVKKLYRNYDSTFVTMLAA